MRRVNVPDLVERGLQLGRNVHIGHGVVIDHSHCWLIAVEDECTLAPGVHILAHDASTKRHIGYTKIGKVQIGKRTFIGAGSIILPGVTIGEDVIIGAGSVVTHDIPSHSIAVGNPAVIVGRTEEYIEKHRRQLTVRPVYPVEGWTEGGGISIQNKAAMRDALQDGLGYVE